MESAQKPDFAVEWWPIGRPKPYPKNARKWSAKAVEKVAASIREFGWRQPLVCDASDVIIIGHLRLAAAHSLSLTEVPVHVARDLSPAKVRALRLADNRLHEEAAWDEDLLREDMLDMRALDLDMGMTGFDSRELDRLLLTPDERADECPPVPENPVSRVGDLWVCGPHRVLCGSCINRDDVVRVLNGSKPFILITDPPYGIELDMEWRDRAGHNEMAPAAKSYMKIAMAGQGISGDTRADWSEAFELVPSLEVAYVWHATSHLVDVAAGLKKIGFEVRQQIIWQKTVAAMGRQAYHWQHEPCWYAVRKGKTARWCGDHSQSTVWEAASPKHIMSGSKEEKFPHPTQKPLELMRRPIANHGEKGDGVYEPFLGSGTTLIAADLMLRRCFGVEIEPRYVDVVVQRWQNVTGREATLEGDGRTFAAISAERTMVTA